MADVFYLDPGGPGSVVSTHRHHRQAAADPHDPEVQAYDAQIADILDRLVPPAPGETDAAAESRLWDVLDGTAPTQQPHRIPVQCSPEQRIAALERSVARRDLAGLLGMLTEQEEQSLMVDRIRLAALRSGGRVVLLADARQERRRGRE